MFSKECLDLINLLINCFVKLFRGLAWLAPKGSARLLSEAEQAALRKALLFVQVDSISP